MEAKSTNSTFFNNLELVDYEMVLWFKNLCFQFPIVGTFG